MFSPLRMLLLISSTLIPLAGIYVYLYRRFIRDLGLVNWKKRIAVTSGVALVSFSLLSRGLSFYFPSLTNRWLSFWGAVWAGVVLYLLFFRIGLELIERVRSRVLKKAVPNSPERRVFISRMLAGTSAIASGTFSGYGISEAMQLPQVTEIVVRLPQLPKSLDGFTMVQLSDLHIGGILQKQFVDGLISRANALHPDLIAITGDLVDGNVARLGGFVAPLRNLKSRHGTYFVTGNHDYYSGVEPWVRAIGQLGITVLRNRFISIGDSGGSFDLIGVDDWNARHWKEGGYDLERALRGRQPERASVLLAHQPSNFEVVAKRGIGLQLSGHTHGGQLFPGNLVVRALLGPRVSGYSAIDQSQIYVSRGCGFVGPPMRVGSPPELVKIVLLAT